MLFDGEPGSAWMRSLRIRASPSPPPACSAKPCSRCKVTTIDQETGEESATGEPLVTLQEVRAASSVF